MKPCKRSASRWASSARSATCRAISRSDEKQHKIVARKMIELVRSINPKFPDGKDHVTCYTCHRGAQEPLMAPPANLITPAGQPARVMPAAPEHP